MSNTTVPGPVISNAGAKASATWFSSAAVVRCTQANIASEPLGTALQRGFDFFIEVEGDVYRVGVPVVVGFVAAVLQVIENAAFFHAIEKMFRVVDVEGLAFTQSPHLADSRLGFDIETDDDQFREEELRAWRDP